MSHSPAFHPTLKFILSIQRFFFIFRHSTRKLKDIFKLAGFRGKPHYALSVPISYLIEAGQEGVDCSLFVDFALTFTVWYEVGEKMLNSLLQNHPVFILMESLLIIWDFRLRILDLWNRSALSIYNKQDALGLWDNPDTQCGFKMLSQYAAREIATRMVVDRFGFDFELIILAHKLGFKVKQMPVRWRHEKSSSITFSGPNGFIRILMDLVKTKYRLIKGGYNLYQTKRI